MSGSRPLESAVYGRALTFRRRGSHASTRQAHGRTHSDRLGGYQHNNGGEARGKREGASVKHETHHVQQKLIEGVPLYGGTQSQYRHIGLYSIQQVYYVRTYVRRIK